jgi:hypothetical protein
MKLQKMCEGKQIEILYLMDNKKRSGQEKFNDLMNMSHGKYFMFCHDDDDILRIDEVYQATFQDVDVIAFKQLCDSPNEAKTPYVVTFGLGNPIEETQTLSDGSFTSVRRPPWTVCAWNQKFKSIPYTLDYAEDGIWVTKALAEAKTEVFVDVFVHHYRWDVNTTSDLSARNNVLAARAMSRGSTAPLGFLRRR